MNSNQKNKGAAPLNKRTRTQIISAIAVGTFMAALDSSVVNIALPNIGSYFGAPLPVIEWVVMSYLLIISSLLLTYGRLGDMYGHKRIYMTGFGIFTSGSLLCGAAPTIVFLIICRAIQAIGAGMMMSMGPAIITETAKPEERGRALGANAVAVAVALTTGPVLGGLLTSYFGWQSIFYINIPIGIIGMWWANRVIPGDSRFVAQPFDVWGAVLVFFSLMFVLTPLSYTEKFGWSSPYILFSLILGFILLIVFILLERRIKHPMLDLTLFKNRLFSMSNLSALLNYMAQFSVTLLMPFYLQELRGLPPSRAGLLLIPMPLVTTLVAPLSGTISDRMDSRYLSSAGMGIIAFGLWLLSRLPADASNMEIIRALVTVGLGVGIFQTPNNSAIMGSVSAHSRGIASGVLATMRNTGMVLGVAIFGAIFTSQKSHLKGTLAAQGVAGAALETQSFIQAMHLAFTVAAILAGVAVISSLSRGRTKPRENH